MTPLIVENGPRSLFYDEKMTGGRFSMGVVIRRWSTHPRTKIKHVLGYCRDEKKFVGCIEP